MYDIRQFKPVIYLLVFLGISGFAIAAEEPALWVFSASVVVINGWLVWRNKFIPMPRWFANGITLLAFIYVAMNVRRMTGAPILLFGQGLVLLQIIKLFEQRANRDYAQLLVLSWLLMVAAAISTASLGFAIIFFAHMVLLLYGCLLYHLKVETDRARAAQTLPDEKINAATLRQDQRYLPRSMRRLTGLVSVVSLVCAVVVFLFAPRGMGSGMFGRLQLRQPEVLQGFSDEVQFNQVAKITVNTTPVATVRVEHKGKLVEMGSLRLRGATFNRYSQGKNDEWHWMRYASSIKESTVGVDSEFTNKIPPVIDDWHQTVRLEPIGSKGMFALAGIRSMVPKRELKIAFNSTDETLQRTEDLQFPIEYEVVSNNVLTKPEELISQGNSEISPEIIAFARDPQVTGLTNDQTLARVRAGYITDDDERIAGSIERYFKTHFAYSLDLSDVSTQFEGKDPLAVFVSQIKRGHCEYFAGAMTLACQSLGLRARMVTGFTTDEYNSYSEVFQVRQSHAHAWVEVLTTQNGWVVFDPTSGREAPPTESTSAWQNAKHVFEWLELKWGTSVVAYDGGNRESLIQKLDISLVNSANRGSAKISRLNRYWDRLMDRAEFWTISTKLIAGVISMMLLIMFGIIAWYILGRYRIRRRASKIGLNALPMTEQIRLAKQLGFYEEMMEVLGRRRIYRPRHLTPREFMQTLTYLPTDAYDKIERLTRIFYRVRYGGATILPAQQRRLMEVVSRLSETLPPLREA